jgi:DNA polymerase-3 subunit beta
MKFSVLQENLATGLAAVSRAVSTRSTLPVLANVKIDAQPDGVTLTGTNLEIVTSCRVGAMVETSGAITLPARTLADLVGTLPKERVDLELNEKTQTVTLVCGGIKANVKGIDYQEFPMIPQVGDALITIDAHTMKRLIGQSVIATASDSARPVLEGVAVDFNKSGLTFAATDGFRLSLSESVTSLLPQDHRLIIPARSLAEVGRLLDSEPVDIWLSPLSKNVAFTFGAIQVISQLIDGNFPDYNPVIPKSVDTRVVVSTKELKDAAKAVNIFSRLASNTATVNITEGLLTLSGVNAETGDNTVTMDAVVTGPNVSINFNVNYLLAGLQAIDTPQVELSLTRPTEPGVIRPYGKKDFTYVIMPMQFGR